MVIGHHAALMMVVMMAVIMMIDRQILVLAHVLMIGRPFCFLLLFLCTGFAQCHWVKFLYLVCPLTYLLQSLTILYCAFLLKNFLSAFYQKWDLPPLSPLCQRLHLS